jgi:uncharacterized protein
MTRRKYSVLAIDGGGIRGIVPARVLHELETRLGRPTAELFDLIAGTSTGGIIALGLAKPGADGRPAYSAGDLLDLYLRHGEQIFPDSLLFRIRALGGLADTRYPSGPLEALLQERFGDTPLSDALVEVVIPSYDLSRPGPFFFKRSYAQSTEHTWDVPMWLVARATSAAPSYFDPAELPSLEDEGPHALVDGGVFANNPAASAYADALEMAAEPDAEIQVVSIGTGEPPRDEQPHGAIPVPYARALHWGLARWVQPLFETMMDGAAKTVEYQMTRLCRHSEGESPRYHRLQSDLPTARHALDDASPENVARLLDDAETLIAQSEGPQGLGAIVAALEDVAKDRDGAPA